MGPGGQPFLLNPLMNSRSDHNTGDYVPFSVRSMPSLVCGDEGDKAKSSTLLPNAIF